MFIENKYYRWYLALVATDDETGYVEHHHKIPRALGGNDSRSNIVRLSARKHFLAHWLLTKCTTGEDQRAMQWAFATMTRNPSGKRILSSWQFARAREAYRTASLGRPSPMKRRGGWSHEERLQMSIARKGRKLSAEHKAKIGQGLKGKTSSLKGRPRPTPLTPEQVIAYRERMTGNNYNVGRPPPSPETRAKLSAAGKGNKSKTGQTESAETRRKKQQTQLARPGWGKSGLKGVSAYGVGGKFLARLKVGSRRLHLGVFDCPAAAHLAYVVEVSRNGFSL